MIYLDTHVVLWLFEPRAEWLSRRARALIESSDLLLSPMVLLEIDLLHEIGRLTYPSVDVLESLGRRIGLRLCELDFALVIRSAAAETWTRDPFDRVIVGHAKAEGRQLVTRDQTIRSNFRDAVW